MPGFLSTNLLAKRPANKRRNRRNERAAQKKRRSVINQLRGERLEERRVLASYTVDLAADVVAEDGMLSLREAIQAANSNSVINSDTIAGDPGSTATDTISFANGLSAITLGSELSISDSIAISLGADAAQTISGGNASRIFSIVAGNDGTELTSASIEGLTLSDGMAENGGAIFVSAGQSLSLNSVTLTNNVATGSGAEFGGGAVFNDGGVVTVVNSTISDNSASASTMVTLTGAQENPPVTTAATGDATFIYHPSDETFSIDLFVTGVEIDDNDVNIPQVTGAHLHLGEVGSNGDVIVNLDASNFVAEDGGIRLRLSNADFPSVNLDSLIDGGIYINVHSTDNPSGEVRGQIEFPATMGSGGGVLNLGGSLSISNSVVTGNVASRAGGGIESNGGTVTLTGVNLDNNIAGPDGFATPGNGGGLHISGMGDAEISGGTVNGNLAAREGGGLWNSVGVMTVTGTTVSANTASGNAADDGGGGLFNNGGDLQITNATITTNIADGASGSGGGVLNLGGSLTISGTSVTSNTANRAGGGIETAGGTVGLTNVSLGVEGAGNSVADDASPGNGGGLHIGGAAVVTISGGSVIGNEAVEGGGLWNSAAGSLSIDGTTISNNSALRGGGIFQDVATTSQTFTVELETLNAAYGSTATGTATITLDTSNVTASDSGTASIRVQVDVDGLQDLSAVTGGVHVAHIHGQFAGNATKPLAEQGGGSFFSGEGGAVAESVTPTVDDDGARNIDESQQFGQTTDYLDFFEGRPDYGPVVLNLTNEQLAAAPDGTGPLTFFFQQLAAGNIPADAFPNGTEFNRDTTYTFDLSDADERRQYNNLTPLEAREIVLHGLLIPTDISDAIDAATNAAVGSPTAGVPLGNGMSFRRTAPVAAGEIVATSASTSITNATISGNIATGDEATDGGGGIHNLGTLTVTSSTITANTASGTAGSGGGFANAGTANIINSSVTSNTANRAGGGIEATAGSSTTLTGVNLDTNTAGPAGSAAPGNGGGLHITGDGGATISGGTANNNSAASEGGGLWNGSGEMTVTGTTVSGNTASGDDADNGGGGIFNVGGNLVVTDATIMNNVADGASGSGGGVLNSGTSTFMNTTISGNTANRAGGGIEVTSGTSTTLDGVTLSNNIAGPTGTAAPGNGGGMHISGNGSVSLLRTSVVANSADNEGGGLWNSGAGTLDVSQSTLSANTSGDGGGIFNDGMAGVLTVTNSTITGNSATDEGGGIASEGGTVTLTSVTIARNTAATGGGVHSGVSSVATTNSIIASNNATNSNDFSGSVSSNGNNLIGDTNGATLISFDDSNITDVDARLDDLSDNGGPTQTIALLAGSPTLDAGIAAQLTVDQRGIARPQGPAVDIGAFESALTAPGDPPTLSIAATNANRPEGGSGLTLFTFTVTRGLNTEGETSVGFNVSGSGSNPASAADFDGGSFPSGSVTFSDGQSTQTISISVAGDTMIEPDEQFTVVLSNPSGNAVISGSSASGTIQDDDFEDRDTQIFVPNVVARPHLIPGNNLPTAIIFQALSDTTVTVTPVAFASVSETIRILDGNTNPISSRIGGVTTATVSAGELYAILFEPQSKDRVYSVRSSEGFEALSNSPPTNIFSPTDTTVDGQTTVRDALAVINTIARQGSSQQDGSEGEQVATSSFFLDVNRDERVSVLDALVIINHLSRQNSLGNSAEGEGTGSPFLPSPSPTIPRTTSPTTLSRNVDAIDQVIDQQPVEVFFAEPTGNRSEATAKITNTRFADIAIQESSDGESFLEGVSTSDIELLANQR